MLSQLASALGRSDEVPNIELAEKLSATQNKADIEEIVSGLDMKSAIANDCIKVLYEVGVRNPNLTAPYAPVFIRLLKSKNNRLVWGAMTALGQIAALVPDVIFSGFDDVYKAYETGSVITVDHSMSVFAALCAANKEYAVKIIPLLISHLTNCRPKEIPQHLERMAICFTAENVSPFKTALQSRYSELTPPQQKRVDKVVKAY